MNDTENTAFPDDIENTAFPGLRPVRRNRVPGLPGASAGRVKVPSLGAYTNPLTTLVVCVDPPHAWPALHDQDPLEALDAAHEDATGRLPHERGGAS